jgi:hypothetical protein
MNIRNLVLKAKLKKFQKENQDFFLFYYTANASEWRSLKNLLHHEKVKQNQSIYHEQKKLLALEECHKNSLESKKQDKLNSSLSSGICTFFYSEGSTKSLKAKGCFFFLKNPLLEQSNFPFLYCLSSFQVENANFKLVTKIESLGGNQTPIFLYGQINSMLMNHMDIKQASALDIQATYQQLFFSLQSISLSLNLSLQDNINQFLILQESRKHVEIQEKKEF